MSEPGWVERPRVIAFAGPCLPRDPGPRWLAALEGVDVRPPAARGDVLAAVADRPHTIVLLDGYYYTVPSVTHKELLYALGAGVRVIGAASLGALRAAELERFGMVGVGEVFDRYRTGALEGDDEVALLHGPPESGYVPLTIPLVGMRVALEGLVAEGRVEAGAADELVRRVAACGFVERTAERVRGWAGELLDEEGVRAFEEAIAGGGVKERDALAALERARTPPSGDPPPGTPTTGFLGYFKERAFRGPDTGGRAPALLADACRLLLTLHPDAERFVRGVRLRYLLRSAAVEAGLTPREGEAEGRAAALRGWHEDRFGRPLLPEVEYLEEARIRALAELACAALGGREGALAGLARRLRLGGPDPEEALVELLAGQPDALPPWWLVRAASLSSAVEPALALAPEALEIRACLKEWSGGGSVTPESLREVAAELWRCDVREVDAVAPRRGIFRAPGASDGFGYSLELVAAAERLPEPINDYPRLREALRATPLEDRGFPGEHLRVAEHGPERQ